MSYGHHNQGPPPPYSATYDDGEPLFTSPPEERANSMRNPFYQPPTTSTFGAPPMGEPSEPSAHPDNITAATHAGSSQQPGSSYVNPVSSGSSYRRAPMSQHGYPDVGTHHTQYSHCLPAASSFISQQYCYCLPAANCFTAGCGWICSWRAAWKPVCSDTVRSGYRNRYVSLTA